MEEKSYDSKLMKDYGIEISSVSSFIDEIGKIRGSMSGGNQELLFRGQKADFWDIKPSIFRNNFLSYEHILMQTPLLKIPHEFSGLDSKFEIMAKYQHYGMCTRLLDLTTNPLVALYFACEEYGNVTYKDNSSGDEFEQEAYGVVYYCSEYPVTAKDRKVQIVSALSHLDLSKSSTLESILAQLEAEKVITETEKKSWLNEDNFHNFIRIIQEDYIVSPTYSNERLLRQNGVFLLAGSYNFNRSEDFSKSTIERSYKDFRNKFAESFFYVDGNKKKDILKELDMYNINESTLFPELEHQLNYIKMRPRKTSVNPSEFSKYIHEPTNDSDDKTEDIVDNLIDNTSFSENIRRWLSKEYPSLSDKLYDEIKRCVSMIDWYKGTKLSALKVGIRKVLMTDKSNINVLTEKVNTIVNKVLDVAKQVSKRSD